ncbi:MAG: hypothetical protein HFJ53_05605 [Clostridia bacterium]|jgi:hypothetical protein|nr:hypothetical protein [Clostridia bacterium]
MFKKIVKEIIILIMLLTLIVLLLGIFLYDYIPTSKIVPKVEQYKIPDNIKEELSSEIKEESEVIVTRQIDERDLNIYEKGKDYEKGKVNPFSSVQPIENTNNNQQTSTNIGSTNNNQSGTTNTLNTANNQIQTNNKNPNSTGSYLPDKGLK